MVVPTSTEPSLAKSILSQIDLLVREAEETQRPLELDPFRSRLFELFVMADAADLLKEAKPGEPPENDLTPDSVCRSLAEQWKLADAARESFANKQRLPQEHLADAPALVGDAALDGVDLRLATLARIPPAGACPCTRCGRC